MHGEVKQRALIAGLATCGRTAWKTFLPVPRARTRQDDDEHEHEDIEHLGCGVADAMIETKQRPFSRRLRWVLRA